jgi:CheY-like chemotaxis protein
MVSENEVRMSVSDTGIGIAAQDLEAIFQDFVQVDSSLQRRVKGTGLGLPLSRKLATILEGRVHVESSLGEGSVFHLSIPPRISCPAESVTEPMEEFVADPGSQPVLFVEDSPELVMAYKSYLSGTGFQFLSAATVREAEDVLRRTEPSVVVLDIILRTEDTWSLLAKLKQDMRTAKIPVLIISTVEDKGKASHLGADAYILKPIEREDLLGHLMALTRHHGPARILIIDDNEVDRYLLKQHLRKMPVSVTEESSGAAGIRRATDI